MTAHRIPALPRAPWPARAQPGPAAARPPRASRPHREAGARLLLLIWLVALIALAANHPGRLVFDTKLGVDIDPVGFYLRLWHLWNPLEWLGSLQDQYIGYAFPMAPFYLAGHLLGVPAWLTERLWMSLLFAVGATGLIRLAAALGLGSPRTRLLAGLAFALWPTYTILIGSTSASVLPGLLAPWAVLPLVPAVRGGSVTLAAARSGVAVLAMGGVNAVVTLEALIVPACYILLVARGRRRVALGAAWAAAVILATAWWAGPLLFQGRYAFNFLPYIEQAATTTRTMSATAALLGAGNWTAYFNPGTPWLTAGWTMISAPAAIAASAVAGAAGLAGLARRDLPGGRWMRPAAGLAALGALAGYGGPLGGPFHGAVQHLLDGALAPLRNVYKFESVLALVLALGMAHGLAQLTWPARLAGPAGRRVRPSRLPKVAAVAAATAVLAGLALPYLSGQVLNPGSFASVPRYWDQVASFLAARSPREPAFVVPADSHGTYRWGDPIDDPLEPLARSPWIERGLVPFGSAGSQNFLATAETAIESGEQVPGLAQYLDRAGIRYVVVRNDLSPAMVGYTPPPVVHATLAQSGFRRVAAFGPLLTTALSGAATALPGARTAYPAVEVYAAAADVAASPAVALPASQTVLVDGGLDSLLPLAGQGLLAGQPAILAGDPLPAAPARWDVTDGLRRADNAFGLITDNVSATYTAAQVNPPDSQLGAPGDPPRQILPVPARFQTVAALSGAAAVTASSVGSWLTQAPQFDPVNAFDGNPATAWTAGVPGGGDGQWVQVTLRQRRVLPALGGVRLLAGQPGRPVISRVVVTTAAGRAVTTLRPAGETQPLRLAPGPTTWLRLTIAATAGGGAAGAGRAGSGTASAGVRDIVIPGVHVREFLRPAQDPAGQRAPAQAFTFQQAIASPALLGHPAMTAPLARTFTTSSARPFAVSATAVALPGPALTALLARLTPAAPGQVRISASSTLGALPGLGPAGLLGSGPARPWVSATAHPRLTLSWRGDRPVSELVLTPDSGAGAMPRVVRVASPAGWEEAAVGFDGLVTLPRPLVTDQITLTFPASQPTSAAATAAGPAGQPVALSRLSIPALAGLHPARPDPGTPLRLPCGQGPPLTIDGHRYATAVTGQVGALLNVRPVRVELCPATALVLRAGGHTLTAAVPAPFTVTGVSLASTGSASTGSASTAPARPVTVVSWQAERRAVRVGPGARSYLELHQNASPGWVATLNGRRLTPVELDGWQQAYLLPAGPGGVVTLSFAPARSYHLLLAVTILGAAVVLAAALPRRRRRRRRGPGPTPPRAGEPGQDAGLARPGQARRVAVLAGVLAVSTVIFAASGPVGLAVPALALVAWRWPWLRPVIAAAGLLAAGLITATAASPVTAGTGAFSAAAQVCALIGLAVALLPAPAPDSPSQQAGPS